MFNWTQSGKDMEELFGVYKKYTIEEVLANTLVYNDYNNIFEYITALRQVNIPYNIRQNQFESSLIIFFNKAVENKTIDMILKSRNTNYILFLIKLIEEQNVSCLFLDNDKQRYIQLFNGLGFKEVEENMRGTEFIKRIIHKLKQESFTYLTEKYNKELTKVTSYSLLELIDLFRLKQISTENIQKLIDIAVVNAFKNELRRFSIISEDEKKLYPDRLILARILSKELFKQFNNEELEIWNKYKIDKINIKDADIFEDYIINDDEIFVWYDNSNKMVEQYGRSIVFTDKAEVDEERDFSEFDNLNDYLKWLRAANVKNRFTLLKQAVVYYYINHIQVMDDNYIIYSSYCNFVMKLIEQYNLIEELPYSQQERFKKMMSIIKKIKMVKTSKNKAKEEFKEKEIVKSSFEDKVIERLDNIEKVLTTKLSSEILFEDCKDMYDDLKARHEDYKRNVELMCKNILSNIKYGLENKVDKVELIQFILNPISVFDAYDKEGEETVNNAIEQSKINS